MGQESLEQPPKMVYGLFFLKLDSRFGRSLFFPFPQDADYSDPAARDGAWEQPALDPRIEKTTFP